MYMYNPFYRRTIRAPLFVIYIYKWKSTPAYKRIYNNMRAPSKSSDVWERVSGDGGRGEGGSGFCVNKTPLEGEGYCWQYLRYRENVIIRSIETQPSHPHLFTFSANICRAAAAISAAESNESSKSSSSLYGGDQSNRLTTGWRGRGVNDRVGFSCDVIISSEL